MNRTAIWSPCEKPGYAYCVAAKWIWATIIPFNCVVGTLGNIISLAVLSRAGLRKKTPTLNLLCLTTANILFIWTALLRNILLQTHYIDMKSLSSFNCKVHEWVVVSAAMVTVWSIALLTTERLLVTVYPMLARHPNMKTYVKVSTAIVVVVSNLMCCHFALGNELKFKQLNSTDIEGNLHIDVYEECGPSDLKYKQFLSGPWIKIQLFVLTLVPFVLIAFGNAVIAGILWRSRRKTHPQGTTQANKRTNHQTKLLFLLSIFFFITCTPYSVFSIVFGNSHSSLTQEGLAKFQLLYAIVCIGLSIKAALNFVLYCLVGSTFRNQLRTMVSECRTRLNKIFNKRVLPEGHSSEDGNS